jgi:hypothetical protein
MATSSTAGAELAQALKEAKEALEAAEAYRAAAEKELAEVKRLKAGMEKMAAAAKQASEAAIAAAREADIETSKTLGYADKAQKDFNAKTVSERIAMARMVRETPPHVAQSTTFTIDETGDLLGCTERTMYRYKQIRDKTSDKSVLSPLSISSMEWEPGPTDNSNKSVVYRLSEIQRLQLARIAHYQGQVEEIDPDRVLETQLKIDDIEFGVVRQFLTTAMPEDTWPFSIQADGTPICMFEAIERGLLTGESQRLTIRQYGERLAQAAGQREASTEAKAIGTAARMPVDKPREPSSPTNLRTSGM